jgi:hypothetical protein
VLARLRNDDRFMSALSVKMYYLDMYFAELRTTQAVADTVLRTLRTH